MTEIARSKYDYSQLPAEIREAEEQEQEVKRNLLQLQRKRIIKMVRRLTGLGLAIADEKSRILATAGILGSVELAFGDLKGTMEDVLYFSGLAAVESIQGGVVEQGEKLGKAAEEGIRFLSKKATEAKQVIIRNLPPTGKLKEVLRGLFDADLFDDKLGSVAGLRSALELPVDEMLRPMDKVTELAVNRMRATMAQAALEPLDKKTLAKRLAHALSLPASQALTLTNTGLSGMSTEVNNLAAERMAQLGEEVVMVHVGPAPQRDFCQRCYRRAFTLQQVDQLSNGQGLPVKTYVGGYNCQHTWRAMPASQARRFGFRFASPSLVNGLVADFG